MIQVRAVGSPYFYSPGRDINNWFTASVTSALTQAVELNPDMVDDLTKVAQVFAESINASLLSTKPQSSGELSEAMVDIVVKFPQAGGVFLFHLMLGTIGRYISGVRETSEDLCIPVSELQTALQMPGMLAFLSETTRSKAEKELLAARVFPKVMAKTIAAYKVVEGDNGVQTEVDPLP